MALQVYLVVLIAVIVGALALGLRILRHRRLHSNAALLFNAMRLCLSDEPDTSHPTRDVSSPSARY